MGRWGDGKMRALSFCTIRRWNNGTMEPWDDGTVACKNAGNNEMMEQQNDIQLDLRRSLVGRRQSPNQMVQVQFPRLHRWNITSHVTHHTSRIIHHNSHITLHTSYITQHTTHITHHASHITHHASHITHHT
jgi:hypothetical protein